MITKLEIFRLLAFFLLLMTCETPKNIDIQGHRGCRGLLPENTLPAFEKAIQLGVNTLELDVVVTGDHVVLVSHEPYMNHEICLDANGNEFTEEAGKAYNLYQMTFDSIKQFDCGSKISEQFTEQEKIKTYKPSLDEVLKLSIKLNPNIKFNIEIKYEAFYKNIYAPEPNKFVRLVLEVIRDNNALDKCNLQSFDISILEEIRVQSPNMEVALLVDENEDIGNKLNQMSYSPNIISPYFKLLDEKTAKHLKLEGFKVIPWTVNKIVDMQKMMKLEVDGIITDYPNRLIDLMK